MDSLDRELVCLSGRGSKPMLSVWSLFLAQWREIEAQDTVEPKRHYKLFRTPRHIGAYRNAEFVRPGAKPPNSWDDLHFSNCRNRNWKELRRTQWKGKS